MAKLPNSPNSESETQAAFYNLFRFHYERGRGKPEIHRQRRARWTEKSFLDAMDREGGAITDDTLRNWLTRKNLPQPTRKDAFLIVFFPNAATDAKDKEDSEELARAWRDAWYGTRKSAAPRREPAASISDAEWQHLSPVQFEGLVEFALEDPIPSNEGLGWHSLPAILRFGTAKRQWESGMVTFALCNAYLSVLDTSYQVAGGRLIGTNGPLPGDHFRRETGYSEITGPKDDSGHLEDWVLEEPRPIAVVRPAASGGEPLTAQIAAWPIEFDITATRSDSGPPTSVEATKNAVLKALVLDIYAKDGLGRVIVARRRLERKPRE